MVFIAPFIGAAALLSGFASALPRPQSNPVPASVSGSPTTTDTASLTSQTATDTQSAPSSSVTASLTSQSATDTQTTSSAGSTASSMGGSYGAGGNYGSGSYGAGGNYGPGSYGSSYSADGGQWSSSSTWSADATSTASAYGSYSSPMYGSGSSNWGGYDDCVSQCIASFGAPPASYTPTATGGVMGASGSGATHTVIVAPTQGVLRYVPFAVNASVGDTIKFMWGANNHTVTKSSALTPCNKTSDALFNTGRQDKGFTFTQVVNDTNPTFFYCGTPGHCQKGMFGIINPPSALGAPTSVSGMMQSLGANNSDVSAYASYTTKTTANNIRAAGWGGNIDMSSLPDWSRSFVAENVLYTRNFLASNSEVLQENGFIDLSTSGSTPLMIPQDISAVLANNVPATASSPATPSTPATTSAPTPNTGAENLSNGARSLMSSRGVFTLSFAVVTFFAL
jgi:plastocyanin